MAVFIKLTVPTSKQEISTSLHVAKESSFRTIVGSFQVPRKWHPIQMAPYLDPKPKELHPTKATSAGSAGPRQQVEAELLWYSNNVGEGGNRRSRRNGTQTLYVPKKSGEAQNSKTHHNFYKNEQSHLRDPYTHRVQVDTPLLSVRGVPPVTSIALNVKLTI